MINLAFSSEERILESHRKADADEWTMAILCQMNYLEVVEWYKSWLSDKIEEADSLLERKRELLGWTRRS